MIIDQNVCVNWKVSHVFLSYICSVQLVHYSMLFKVDMKELINKTKKLEMENFLQAQIFCGVYLLFHS